MKRLATLLLVALALPLVLVALLGFTPWGTRALSAFLPGVLPVEIDYRSGRLLGRLELSRIRLALPGGEVVELRDWHSSLRGDCLWRSSLCLDALTVGQVQVDLPASSSSAKAPPERLQLPAVLAPMPVEIRALTIEHLILVQGGEPLAELALRAALTWAGETLNLTRVAVGVTDIGRLSGAGELTLIGDWPLLWRGSVTAGDAGQLPVSLRGQTLSLVLSGTPARLQAQIGLAAPVEARVTLELDALTAELPFHLSAQVEPLAGETLEGLPEWPQGLPAPGLREPLALEVIGDLAQQQLTLDAGLALPDYPALSLQARLNHRSGSLLLEQLQLREGAAHLQLAGRLDYTDERLDWELQLSSQALRLPAFTDALWGEVAGGLQTSGHWAGEQWSVALAEADLQGEINGLPATLQGSLEADSDVWIRSGQLLLEANGASLALAAAEAPATAAALALRVPDLGRWQTGVGGSLQVLGELSEGLRTLQLEGSAENLAWGEAELPAAQLQAILSLAQNGPLQGRLLLERPRLGGQSLERLEARLDGFREASRLDLRSEGDLAGELQLEAKRHAGGWQIRLQEVDLQTPLGPLGSDRAISLNWAGERGELQPHCWSLPDLRLCSDTWVLGSEGGGRASLSGDLASLEPLMPATLSVSGPLQGEVSSRWSADQSLVLEASLSSENGSITRWLAEGESASWQWDRLSASANVSGGALAMQATLLRDGATPLAVRLQRAPGDASGESAGLGGSVLLRDLQLATFQPFVASLSELGGSLNGDLQVSGSLATPRLDGALNWRQGSLAVHGNPTVLDNIDSQLRFRGREAELAGSGRLGDGPLNLQGQANLDPQLQFGLDLKGEGNRLLYPPDTEATVSSELGLRWQRGLLTLRGDVEVLEGILAYEHLPEGGVDLSSDVVEVDYRGRVLREEQGLDMDARLRLRIRDRFLVQGKDVEVRVGGDLRLQQAPGSPLQLFGNLNVLGGELEAYGQQLSVQPGRVAFSGLPGNPELDLRATRQIRAEDVRAGVHITGTLEQPRLEIYTDPVTSQTEALSYLVRGRGLDAGGGTDSTALALSLGTGLVNRSVLVEGLNRLPGVSEIEFGTEGSEQETAATVSGYIGERLYLSYGVGLYEPVNVLTARLYLQTRLWLEVVSRLENSVDIYYSFDID